MNIFHSADANPTKFLRQNYVFVRKEGVEPSEGTNLTHFECVASTICATFPSPFSTLDLLF